MKRLKRTVNSMVRWMCGVTVKDMIQTMELRKRLGIECVSNVVRRGRLRWFGHVERKENDDWVSACRELQVEGTRPRGRPRMTWNECVANDMKELGLRKEDAQDRTRWRGLISGNRPTLPQCGNEDSGRYHLRSRDVKR